MKTSLFHKLIYFLNAVFALLLLLSLLVPYLPPAQFPLLSVLSLAVAPLIFVQILFLFYWIVRVKKQLLLPLVVLVVCFVQFNSFYRIAWFNNQPEAREQQLKVMSYNVRSFNSGRWIADDSVPQKIARFLVDEAPDVIGFQEYNTRHTVDLSAYPYRYTKPIHEKGGFGQAIYSKYPIVNQGSLDFEDTANNALFVDIRKGQDTLRVYNLHLQSLSLNPDDLDFDQEASKRLIRRIANAFEEQQKQVEKVVAHQRNAPYKTIVTADLNNTAFSYTYRKAKGRLNDTFAQSGQGLGTTFALKKIPLRIDFIFADPHFETREFTTHPGVLSDHFAISATLQWD